MGKPHSLLYGVRVKDLARICHVDLSTARRWKRGATCPPPTALLLLEGDLGIFDLSWRGWRIEGEFLLPPQGWPVRRNDALAVPLLHGQIQALCQALSAAQREIGALKRVAERSAEQPTPAEWIIHLK